MPIITLEVLSNTNSECVQLSAHEEEVQSFNGDLQFLTEQPEEHVNTEEKEEQEANKSTRTDLLEYMMRNDGSVVCKLCGEILQSRTHWYRHKYKLHVIPPLHTAPLFQCEQCSVYFKSRKGYIGHLASKHSEVLSDSSPVLTNAQAEASTKDMSTQADADPEENEEQPDPELSIPMTSVPNYQTSLAKQATVKVTETKKPVRRGSKDSSTQPDSDDKRTREEKLVADIIDRVRRECEAQGSGGAARRGYSRRYTVMHT